MNIKTYVYQDHRLRVGHQGQTALICATDVVKALGVTNTTYTLRGLADEHVRTISVEQTGAPPCRMKMLTASGFVELLTSKPKAAYNALLAWADEHLLPFIVDELAEQPLVVKTALRGLSTSEAPWESAAVHYEGKSLYEDPHTQKLWASQRQIAGVFGCTVWNVGKHLEAAHADGLLDLVQHTRLELIPLHQGKHEAVHKVVLYDFQAISAVGDRVSSEKGMAFRAWRANWLEEHLTGRDASAREIADLNPREARSETSSSRSATRRGPSTGSARRIVSTSRSSARPCSTANSTGASTWVSIPTS